MTAIALLLTACRPSAAVEEFAGPTMGTTYHVTVGAQPPTTSRTAIQSAIDAVLRDVDLHLSTYRPDSEISRFNADTGVGWVTASPALLDVVRAAQRVSEESGGVFDITVAPLVDAWGFGADSRTQATTPATAQLESLRSRVGFRKIEWRDDPPALRKLDPRLHLDVAGIAPGYAVDLISRRFVALGIRSAIVELGGEVRAWGRSPAGRPWRVAVETPVAGERRPYTLVDLDDMSISTSGDYREFRLLNGRRLSHTIDPRTGAPVSHDLASVTVLHPSDTYADAYATALMVLGPEAGYAFARRHRLAALFIERTGVDGHWQERATPEFARLRHPVH